MNTDQSRIDDLIARLDRRGKALDQHSRTEFRRSFAARLPSAFAMAGTSLSPSTTRPCFCDVVTFALERTFACGERRPGIDVAPGFGFGHQPVTFSCSPDDLRHARAGRPNGGIKAWHFAKRVTSPSTISRWRQTGRVKSANSCAATS